MKYDSAEAHAQYRFMVMMRESFRMEHFNNLFPFLAEDCSLESSWLSIHEVGNTAVKAFLDDSLEERWQRNIPWNYGVAQLLAAPEGSDRKGLFGLYIRRDTNDAYNSILITAAMDEQGKAKQIWIEDARPCRFRVFLRCIGIADIVSDVEGSPLPFLLPEPYWDYLWLSLSRVTERPHLSRHSHFSLPQLRAALSQWHAFSLANSYDSVFEELGGVNYRAGHCQFPEIAAFLGQQGGNLWENRHAASAMCGELSEWADSADRSMSLRFLPSEGNAVIHLTGGNV